MKDIRELYLFNIILINILGTVAIDLVLYNEKFTCLDKDDKFTLLLINIGPMFFSFILIIDFFLYGCYGCIDYCLNCHCTTCYCEPCSQDCNCGNCNSSDCDCKCDCKCDDCKCDDCKCNDCRCEGDAAQGAAGAALILCIVLIALAIIAGVLALFGFLVYFLTKGVGKKYSRRIALSFISFFQLLIAIYCTNLYLDDTEINKDYIIIIGISGFLCFINILGIILPNCCDCCELDDYDNKDRGSIIVQPLVKKKNESDKVKSDISKDNESTTIPVNTNDNYYNPESITPIYKPDNYCNNQNENKNNNEDAPLPIDYISANNIYYNSNN